MGKKENTVKQYRVALLRKEFPFIDKMFVDSEGRTNLLPEDINDIKVKRGDKALLAKKGSEDSYSWCNGGHYNYTKYFAVWSDEDRVLELASAGYSGTGSGERHEWDAGTIGEQLFVKGIAPDFVVECVKNDTDDNGNGEVTRFWTIYKMKRFDLGTHHQEQIDKAAAALKAEIASVCACA
ncbi:MAG TPA: hypothetical protein VJB39_02480 [Patescibacteria group bacterium]|nr:hypothetical protein [Patescibacteria group bacterium]